MATTEDRIDEQSTEAVSVYRVVCSAFMDYIATSVDEALDFIRNEADEALEDGVSVQIHVEEWNATDLAEIGEWSP